MHLLWQGYYSFLLFCFFMQLLIYFLNWCQLIYGLWFEWVVTIWYHCSDAAYTSARNPTSLNLSTLCFDCIAEFILHNIISVRRFIKPFRILASKKHLLKLFFPSSSFISFHLNKSSWFDAPELNIKITHIGFSFQPRFFINYIALLSTLVISHIHCITSRELFSTWQFDHALLTSFWTLTI